MNQQTSINTAQVPTKVQSAQSLPTCAVFSEAQTAQYIGLSVSNLRKGRMNGRRVNYVAPPPYLKLGRRIAYLKADLDAWLMSQRVEV